MTKFQKIQKLSSIVPVFSSFFVFTVTMFELKRQKASAKHWLLFCLIFFLSGFVATFVNHFVMSGQNPILNVIAVGLILAIANILCVNLQIMAAKDAQKDKPTSNKWRWITIGIAAGIATIVLIVSFVFIRINGTKHIDDTNGEDTSLTTITMDDIISDDYGCVSYMVSSGGSGDQTNVTGLLDEYDHATYKIRVKKISGVKVLQVTNTSEDTVCIHVDSELISGNAAIVIFVDGQFHSQIEPNTSQLVELTGVANKTIVVKLAAESANISVTVTRGQGDGSVVPDDH